MRPTILKNLPSQTLERTMKRVGKVYSSSVAAVPSAADLSALIPPAIKEPIYTSHTLSIQTLMAANLHLGHNKSTWNPSMLPFIYGHRQGVHIINLDHTLAALRRACGVVKEVAAEGGNVLFVGTKPSLHKLMVTTAKENNAFFSIHWTGGLMTNKERVLRRSVGYDPDKVTQNMLPQSQNTENDEDEIEIPDKQPYVHKPDLLVLFDYPNTIWAVREAQLAKIPVIAICDTDCDPSQVQYPIPANDDSLAGLRLIAGVLGKAHLDGIKQYESRQKLDSSLKEDQPQSARSNRQY
ncbi:ribosomal protein S2, flavodoxin-like domain-containing protein [Globomyces pollinis-pini]|nr:ribosomal protein S2, flavodoxin-like domain-containing protein [Globomyces pollinis-pini]